MPTIFKVHYRLYYGRLRLQLLRPFHWICRITWSSLTYPHLDSGASNGIRTRDSCLASNCITTILYLHASLPLMFQLESSETHNAGFVLIRHCWRDGRRLWCHELGSNQRHAGYESATLPTELSWHKWYWWVDSNHRLSPYQSDALTN